MNAPANPPQFPPLPHLTPEQVAAIGEYLTSVMEPLRRQLAEFVAAIEARPIIDLSPLLPPAEREDDQP